MPFFWPCLDPPEPQLNAITTKIATEVRKLVIYGQTSAKWWFILAAFYCSQTDAASSEHLTSYTVLFRQ